MANEKIIDYIRAMRAKDMPDEKIRQNLLRAGWKVEQVTYSFAELSSAPPSGPVPSGGLGMEYVPSGQKKMGNDIARIKEILEQFQSRLAALEGLQAAGASL